MNKNPYVKSRIFYDFGNVSLPYGKIYDRPQKFKPLLLSANDTFFILF